MKIFNIILKVLLCLILVMPVLGLTGIFPEPTAEMYSTSEAFAFIQLLNKSQYTMYLMTMVFLASILLIIMDRMALAALAILPITVNIVAFHLFLDGGLLTSGAVMGNVLLLLNLYFIWQSRAQYKVLWTKGV
jgi:hypothetical protein